MPHGKLGRLPLDRSKPMLVLERYLDPRTALSNAGLPPVSWGTDVDRSSGVPSYPMYLNDQLGDCTIAGIAHLFGAVSFYGSGTEVLFADSEVQTVYSRVGGYVPGNPSTDQGCVMGDVLNDNHLNGITDTAGVTHKLEAWATLGNPADENLIAQCLDVFGSVYVGCNVQSQMETQFDAGQVWTWTPGAQVLGGHAIVLQRRYPCGSMHGVLEYVTWGARQRADFAWQSAAVDEAHVVVTPEWIAKNGTSVAGLDLQQMLADMQDVTAQ